MLSVGKVGPGNAGYYESAVVRGTEDYYAGDGDAPGRWIGQADLVGAVAGSLATAGDAKLLLEAKCAPDGTRLGRTNLTERSVTAFDLTFSAPKSISILHALGDDDVVAAIDAAHTASVEQAIASMSSRIAYTRTGHAGAAIVDTEAIFGIRYRHRTSRTLDPQLHDHVLISNAVRTKSDGQWRTLDARGLYREAKAAGVSFQSFLRAELTASLGVEFREVDANGQADVVGIDDVLLAEFSLRSVDIEAELADWTAGFVKREGRPPSPAQVGKAHKTITLATRPAKPGEAALLTTTLREGWRTRADRFVDVDQMHESTLRQVPSPAVIVRPTVDEVLAAVETKHAEWAEPQLIEQIAARTTGPDAATVASVIEGVRLQVMASVGVVDLTPDAEPGDVVRASDGRPTPSPPAACSPNSSSTPDVVTLELDTLHRFDHDWEAAASLRLRDGDTSAVEAYARHDRIHGHDDQNAAIDAVASVAYDAIVQGREVLVMAPTNSVVDEINTTLTERLLATRWLDPNSRIEVAGHVFYPGQPVVTRANDRRLAYGPGNNDWVRNGDRWTITTGARDELRITNRKMATATHSPPATSPTAWSPSTTPRRSTELKVPPSTKPTSSSANTPTPNSSTSAPHEDEPLITSTPHHPPSTPTTMTIETTTSGHRRQPLQQHFTEKPTRRPPSVDADNSDNLPPIGCRLRPSHRQFLNGTPMWTQSLRRQLGVCEAFVSADTATYAIDELRPQDTRSFTAANSAKSHVVRSETMTRRAGTQLNLRFGQLLCACGENRIRGQTCQACGRRPKPTEIDSALQRRRSLVAYTRNVLAHATRRKTEAGRDSIMPILESSADQLASLVRLANEALAGRAEDGFSEFAGAARQLVETDEALSSCTELRPARAMRRHVSNLGSSLGVAVTVLLDALHAGLPGEAQRHGNKLQPSIDAAADSLSNALAVLGACRSIEESSSPLVALIQLATLNAGSADLLDFATFGSAEIAARIPGAVVPIEHGFLGSLLSAQATTVFDEETFWSIAGRVFECLTSDSVNLRLLVVEPGWAERWSKSISQSFWAAERSAALLSSASHDEQFVHAILEACHHTQEGLAKTVLASVRFVSNPNTTFAAELANGIGSLAAWAAANGYPEASTFRTPSRNAFAHIDWTVDASTDEVVLCGLKPPAGGPVRLSGAELDDHLLAVQEITVAIYLGFVLAANEAGIALPDDDRLLTTSADSFAVAMLLAAGYDDVELSDSNDGTVDVSGRVDRSGSISDFVVIAHLFPRADVICIAVETPSGHHKLSLDLDALRSWSGEQNGDRKMLAFAQLLSLSTIDNEPISNQTQTRRIVSGVMQKWIAGPDDYHGVVATFRKAREVAEAVGDDHLRQSLKTAQGWGRSRLQGSDRPVSEVAAFISWAEVEADIESTF